LKSRGIKRPGKDGTARLEYGEVDNKTGRKPTALVKAIDLQSFVKAAQRYCPDVTPRITSVTGVTG
jgi:hypothetical protein